MGRLKQLLALTSALLLLLTTPAFPLPTNSMAWNYDAALPGGTTLTGFQIRRCTTTACGASCTLADLVAGAVGPAVRTFSDLAVLAGTSYVYDIQAVGTSNSVPVRSTASSQICRRPPRPGPHSVGGGKIVR